MGEKLLQWLRRTPALWLVLAVELLMVGQAVWAALQPLLYYPGYTVVDGPGATYLTVNGMVGVTVPAGYAGTISVAFREPKRWLLADGVSLVTLLGMIGWSPWKKRRAVSKK